MTDKESFTKRFLRLTAGLSDGQLMDTLGLTLTPIRKLQNGETTSLKLDAGLRLAARLKISPWYLAGEPEPTGATMGPRDMTFEQRQRAIDDVIFTIRVALNANDPDRRDYLVSAIVAIEHVVGPVALAEAMTGAVDRLNRESPILAAPTP